MSLILQRFLRKNRNMIYQFLLIIIIESPSAYVLSYSFSQGQMSELFLFFSQKWSKSLHIAVSNWFLLFWYNNLENSLIRDRQQITFITLNGFCLLSKNLPPLFLIDMINVDKIPTKTIWKVHTLFHIVFQVLKVFLIKVQGTSSFISCFIIFIIFIIFLF